MEASKLTISNNTLKLNKLSQARKRQLRTKRVKEIIRDTPSGQEVSTGFLRKALNYNTDAAVHYFINTLVAKGVVRKLHSNNTGIAYEVCEDVITKSDTIPWFRDNMNHVWYHGQYEPKEQEQKEDHISIKEQATLSAYNRYIDLAEQVERVYDEFFLEKAKEKEYTYWCYRDTRVIDLIEWLNNKAEKTKETEGGN